MPWELRSGIGGRQPSQPASIIALHSFSFTYYHPPQRLLSHTITLRSGCSRWAESGLPLAITHTSPASLILVTSPTAMVRPPSRSAMRPSGLNTAYSSRHRDLLGVTSTSAVWE